MKKYRAEIIASLLVFLLWVGGYAIAFQFRSDLVDACDRGNILRVNANDHEVEDAITLGRKPNLIQIVNCEEEIDKPWPF